MVKRGRDGAGLTEWSYDWGAIKYGGGIYVAHARRASNSGATGSGFYCIFI